MGELIVHNGSLPFTYRGTFNLDRIDDLILDGYYFIIGTAVYDTSLDWGPMIVIDRGGAIAQFRIPANNLGHILIRFKKKGWSNWYEFTGIEINV